MITLGIWAMIGTVTPQEQKAELEAVLASEVFTKSPNMSRLLSYICNRYFEGAVEDLKEYNIGVEALGRPADFDPTMNSVVRVEAYRLREKLKKYYAAEGAEDAIRIQIDPGHYVPRFIRREQGTSPPLPLAQETPNSHDRQSAESHAPAKEMAEEHAPQSSMHHFVPILIAMVVLAIVVASVLIVPIWRHSAQGTFKSHVNSSSLTPSAPTSATSDTVRILCGYSKDKYIDRSGKVWTGDRDYSGGAANSQPPEFIARAPDEGLFQAFRSGNFSYDIPLKPGNYEARLYFCETHYGPGSLSGGGETSRLFNISMNGKSLLKIFDIIKDAGGNDIGDIRVFKDVRPAADGRVHFKFESLIDAPVLNAIEIEPAPPGKINPIRIVAQNNSYTDHLGNIWSPDRYFSGGQLATHITRAAIRGTADPNLFTGERFGNFSYAIPVAPGKYRLTLSFAETYWGVENRTPSLPDQNGSLKGGAGSRLFDVYCNGVILLRHFDIFSEAGGALIAVERTFHDLEPNAEGKLMLEFVPVRDYASVTGLEVEDETQ